VRADWAADLILRQRSSLETFPEFHRPPMYVGVTVFGFLSAEMARSAKAIPPVVGLGNSKQ
jgi:hypothetical protein